MRGSSELDTPAPLKLCLFFLRLDMESIPPVLVALVTILVVSTGSLLVLWLRTRKRESTLIKKYAPIINADQRIQELNKESSEIRKHMESLKRSYQAGLEKYEALKKEISTLEESLELMDFGLYRPHYNYDTSAQFKEALDQNYEKQKDLISSDKAIFCNTEWTVEGSKAEGRKMTKQNMKIMLRAFNAECDACVGKVRWDNALKMEARIRKSFDAINKSGEVNKIEISRAYLDAKFEELRLTHELAQKVQDEKDEQRRIQEEMREEEKAQRELERAQKEAEKDEERYAKALEKAREEVEKLSGEKARLMQEKIHELEQSLAEATAAKERAVSQAQLTKSGYVYIISNIGSFGDGIYKIGMTRRLEPMDRIKELGDASVPFPFDVHGMIYSENAPELEGRLHQEFANKSVNLINARKEFFQVSLEEISSWSKQTGFNLELTLVAEAREYRETLKIRQDSRQSEGDASDSIPALEHLFEPA